MVVQDAKGNVVARGFAAGDGSVSLPVGEHRSPWADDHGLRTAGPADDHPRRGNAARANLRSCEASFLIDPLPLSRGLAALVNERGETLHPNLLAALPGHGSGSSMSQRV
ncbi:MAG: hypothetical protein IPG96_17755 [Proteobacteria bacterium]|nr:hypothetical protein [Pseudomonadota bacterium]